MVCRPLVARQHSRERRLQGLTPALDIFVDWTQYQFERLAPVPGQTLFFKHEYLQSLIPGSCPGSQTQLVLNQ